MITPAPEHPRGEQDVDQWLIAGVRQGDHRAFSSLYRRHAPRVWRLLTRVLGADTEREDLLQQVFVDVFKSLDGFRGDAAFATYLHRVAFNRALEHLDRRRGRPVLDSLDHHAALEATDSPERRAAARERLSFVWVLLDRMKPKKRIAFILRVVEGWTLEEIGEAVGARPNAVAQRVRHAYRELDTMLARRRRGNL